VCGQFAHETTDFRFAAEQLDNEALDGWVEHPAAGAYHVATQRVAARWFNAQFCEHQLAFQMLAARHVINAHHVDQLAKLIDDLLDDRVGAAGHQRQARNRRSVGGCHRQ